MIWDAITKTNGRRSSAGGPADYELQPGDRARARADAAMLAAAQGHGHSVQDLNSGPKTLLETGEPLHS